MRSLNKGDLGNGMKRDPKLSYGSNEIKVANNLVQSQTTAGRRSKGMIMTEGGNFILLSTELVEVFPLSQPD